MQHQHTLDQEWPQNMHRCLMASISKLNGGILCTCRTPMLKENQLLDWHTPLAGQYVWNNNSGPVYKKSMFVDRKRCSSVSKSRPPWPHSRLCGSITPSLYGSINILKGQLQDNHGNTGHHGNATKFHTGIEKMNFYLLWWYSYSSSRHHEVEMCSFVRWIGIDFDTCMPPAEWITTTLWSHDLPSGVHVHF